MAAPIAIVASCSNDTTAVKSESQVEVDRLNGVIQSSKIKIKDTVTFTEQTLNELKNAPNKLLTDYLVQEELGLNDTKFNYEIVNLSGVDPKQDAPAVQEKTMNFQFKVTSKTNPNENATTAGATVTYKYQPSAQPPATPDPLDEAIAKIEKAYDANTFKLKDEKQTIPKSEIDTLVANPENFLNGYTTGLPAESDLGQGITTKVIKANFRVEDKPAGSRQGQAPTTKKQLIKFKVTVAGPDKKEKETKEFSFEFTLDETPPTPPSPQPPGGGGGRSTPFSTKNNSK